MVSEQFGLELDLLFVRRTFSSVNANGSWTSSDHLLEFPLLARWKPIQYLAVGFGPYLGLGVGSLSFSGSGESGTGDYNDEGLHRLEYGMAGSIRGEYPVSPSINALIDIRYVYGLSNKIANPAVTTFAPDAFWRERQWELLAGATWKVF
jgi:hypothetical protein